MDKATRVSACSASALLATVALVAGVSQAFNVSGFADVASIIHTLAQSLVWAAVTIVLVYFQHFMKWFKKHFSAVNTKIEEAEKTIGASMSNQTTEIGASMSNQTTEIGASMSNQTTEIGASMSNQTAEIGVTMSNMELGMHHGFEDISKKVTGLDDRFEGVIENINTITNAQLAGISEIAQVVNTMSRRLERIENKDAK